MTGRMVELLVPLAETVIPNQSRLLDFSRRNGLRVVYLTVGPELTDGSDLNFIIKRRVAKRQRTRSPATVFPKGTFEHSSFEELKPGEGELVINKICFGAFHSTATDCVL